MPNWRRAHAPGGTFFFTLVTDGRAPILCDPPARLLLGSTLRRCQRRWPFTINAIVLLPDHLHAIWSLPPGDTAYPGRWGWIKKEFTKHWLELGGVEQSVSTGGWGRSAVVESRLQEPRWRQIAPSDRIIAPEFAGGRLRVTRCLSSTSYAQSDPSHPSPA
jgi:REP element-mobilizing transposase RayT